MGRKKTFVIKDGKLEKYNGKASEVVIPEGVTEIGDEAFAGNENLQNVTVPQGVVTIGTKAFYDCRNLQKVELPDSVEKIGDWAFCGSALQRITIPEKVTSVSRSMLSGCTGLQDITLNDNIISIDDNGFYGCNKLREIEMPKNLERIGENAFYSCKSLERIVLPNSVSRIGRWAFSSCIKLESVRIPKGITVIEESMFSMCETLQSVELPEDVSRVGKDAFYKCVKLENIALPEGIKSIGKRAFYGCDNLKILKTTGGESDCLSAHEGEGGIEERAFCGCRNLQVIEIPENIAWIEERAFSGCSALEKVHITKGLRDMGDHVFLECDKLREITVSPENRHVKFEKGFLTIGEKLIIYMSDEGRKNITVPDTVTEIVSGAFISPELEVIDLGVKEKKMHSGAFCGENLMLVCMPREQKEITVHPFEDKEPFVLVFDSCIAERFTYPVCTKGMWYIPKYRKEYAGLGFIIAEKYGKGGMNEDRQSYVSYITNNIDCYINRIIHSKRSDISEMILNWLMNEKLLTRERAEELLEYFMEDERVDLKAGLLKYIQQNFTPMGTDGLSLDD